MINYTQKAKLIFMLKYFALPNDDPGLLSEWCEILKDCRQEAMTRKGKTGDYDATLTNNIRPIPHSVYSNDDLWSFYAIWALEMEDYLKTQAPDYPSQSKR